MRIVALIMAGGKSQRFGKDIEKPLIKLKGKTLIQRVIEATKASKKIFATYVAATPNAPRTAKEAAKASAKVIETDGLGYHTDLRQAVLKASLSCPVLTISSDLPLLTGKFLDEIIDRYERSKKPALTVLIPVEECRKYGVHPTSFCEHKGKKYAVSGINMIEGQLISKKQKQEVIISTKPEAIFNINNPNDLEAAKNYLLRSKLSSKQNKER
jgi:adenosylcobinamide-phosphate guanylyltransferase